MTLSCSCPTDGCDWYYWPPKDFINFPHKRRKRCISCTKLIDNNAPCAEFDRWRSSYTYIEERIYGDEVPLAPVYACQECAEIFFNLTDIGYCINLGYNLHEVLEEYWELTGFSPTQNETC